MKKILFSILGIVVLIILLRLFVWKPALPIDYLKGKYAQDDSRWVQIDDLEVHYKDEGSGTPIVLIHGTGASLQTFDSWTDTLKKYYRVIRMDIPGFGLTGPNREEDYSMVAYVKFIDHFLQKIQVAHVILGGNSLGGEIAWKYAYYHPQNVQALILLDPAGSPIQKYDMPLFSAFTLAKIPVLSSLFTNVNPKPLVEKTLKQAYEKDELITPDKVQLYYDMSLRDGNRKAFVQRVQQVANDSILDPSKVLIPTMIMWGKQDAVLPLIQLDGFKKMKHMRYLIYDGVGHTPQDEVSIQSVHDAINFIRELGEKELS